MNHRAEPQRAAARHSTPLLSAQPRTTPQHNAISDCIRLTVPFVPTSKKNGMRVVGRRLIRSHRVARQESNLALLAAQQFGWRGKPLFGTDEVSIRITRRVAANVVEVEVTNLGPPPKGRTGRDRDTQNLGDSICDALQGIAYRNDNQVQRITIERLP